MKKTFVGYKILFFMFLIVGCSKDDTSTPPTPEPESFAVSISATSRSAAEPGTNGQFTIALNKAISSDVTIDYIITGTATNGTDYETVATSVNIPANTASVTIPVVVLSDFEVEETETVIITLTASSSSNVKISTSNTATVTIEDEPESMSFLPSEAASYMTNPNSTEETVALFYNLKILSETSIVVGQQDAFSVFYNDQIGDSDIKKTTGSDPGLLGSDFIFITDNQNDGTSTNWFYQQEQMVIEDVIEAYDKGMINTFAWHFREPYDGEHFYAEDMTQFQRENAFKSILPGGANHDYYLEKLDKVVEVAGNLIGTDGKLIPFIFRPFHEFDGSWFWWGAAYCTPEEFKTLWQFTVEYLRDTKGVNNILFAFSPDNSYSTEAGYLSRYPGDNYVDILGMDNYGDFNNQGQTGVNNANNKLEIISNLAKERRKIAALTETGYFVTPGQNNAIPDFYAENMYNAITNNDVELGFLMFWNNYGDTYCTPPPSESTAAQDFNTFVEKPGILLQDEIPNMYILPSD
ncbi:mannan endo-1,4-beta-mannosidase [Saonia flava]|uniref:Mannan endo-1,4-beta-mannosidase n=1 Tax=Saonia flava TaxID=523696 RepID=A0A846R4B6_9FLAO|nr:glycosyl hydrolase [Saonia flava]NJB72815.1 mannan endo-1,4-beta-mannosidase [Saonia flava]